MWEHIVVKKDTKKLLTVDCKKEFLENNPKFNGMRITQNFILKKVCEHYIECENY